MKGCGVMPREQINYPEAKKALDERPEETGHQHQRGPDGACTTCDAGPVDEDAAATLAAAFEGQRSTERTAPVLHVSWMPGLHVQVAFEADPDYLKVALDAPNEMDGRTSMYTEVLTRAEINKMIKVLRRARDAAYGRDE